MNFLANQSKIKLIALDMDGTLLNDDGKVSETNRKAIIDAQSNGVYVICSTGRSILTSRDHVVDLGLNSYHITVNGSEIWDQKGELLHRKGVPTDHIQWMYNLALKYQTKFWATATNKVWRREMPQDIENHSWLKFGFEIPEEEIRQTILLHLKEKAELFEISNSSPVNIEVNAKGVNKSIAIEQVCDRLGLVMSEVMAVGDSINDLAMIQSAGIGVAMGNAQETVKNKADWVTFTNNEDGVAHAIRTWVLS
ncbi:Cof-type HAD-IIB family hydrolase [Bacillus sp. T3]|uniref:Cof-type HAD-IIB family hydrolase n=1 Tax=Bacillus sp. T3 TaxID=467262 RepID=UPI002981E29A|nr:Cof-type HAD-IIB family hydrolase [Bacillus sp. T3]